MKIGLFTEVYPPYISGVSTSVKMLKDALESMDHTVYIVTANLDRAKFKYDEKEHVIYLPGIKTGIYETRLTTLYSRKALKIIKDWHLDIVHCQTEFGVGAFAHIVAKKFNLPVVHTYHTLYEDYVYYVTHGYFDKLGKKLAVKLTQYYCDKKCDELIVPTDKIKDLFENKYNITKHIHVIPTGIDTKRFELTPTLGKKVTKLKTKYKIKKDDFVIGTVGRIAIEKSFDKELKAFQKLLEITPKAKLMIVGDGPELNNLKKLSQELQIADNVIFTGKIPYDNMPEYYHLFNIMSSFSVTETQGLTIIEGLAASLPIVCIDDESFREMVDNDYNGLFFTTDKEFIKNVLELMNKPQKYHEMTVNAKNSIYKYSKEVFAAEVLKVYHKAIASKKNS